MPLQGARLRVAPPPARLYAAAFPAPLPQAPPPAAERANGDRGEAQSSPPAAGCSNQVKVQPQKLTSDLPQVCCLPPGRCSAGGTAVTDILLPPEGGGGVKWGNFLVRLPVSNAAE